MESLHKSMSTPADGAAVPTIGYEIVMVDVPDSARSEAALAIRVPVPAAGRLGQAIGLSYCGMLEDGSVLDTVASRQAMPPTEAELLDGFSLEIPLAYLRLLGAGASLQIMLTVLADELEIPTLNYRLAYQLPASAMAGYALSLSRYRNVLWAAGDLVLYLDYLGDGVVGCIWDPVPNAVVYRVVLSTGLSYSTPLTGIFIGNMEVGKECTLEVTACSADGGVLAVGTALIRVVELMTPMPRVHNVGGNVGVVVWDHDPAAESYRVIEQYDKISDIKIEGETARFTGPALEHLNIFVEAYSGALSKMGGPIALWMPPADHKFEVRNFTVERQYGVSADVCFDGSPHLNTYKLTTSTGFSTVAERYAEGKFQCVLEAFTPGAITVTVEPEWNDTADGSPDYAHSFVVTAQALEPPTVPRGLKLSAVQNGAATLSWQASEGQGGVAHYTVVRNNTPLGNVSGLALPISGLTEGRQESFEVRAADPAGRLSLPAVLSTTVRPAIPERPQVTVANQGVGQITLAWPAAANSDGYKINYGISAGVAFPEIITTTLGQSFELLESGTYYFEVRAYRGTTVSAPAYLERAIEGGLVLDGVRATLIDFGSVALEWQAPPLAKTYELTYGYAGGTPVTITTRDTTHTFVGLPGGQEYTFVLVALSDGDRSAEVSTHLLVPGEVVPDTPQVAAELDPDTGYVHLSFSAAPMVSRYVITYSAAGVPEQEQTTSETSYTFTDLQMNATYTFSVVAYNSVGPSLPASIEVDTPSEEPPEAPDIDRLDYGADWIELEFSADRATYYNVIYGEEFGDKIELQKIQSPYRFEGLLASTDYFFQVWAGNAAGLSEDYAEDDYYTASGSTPLEPEVTVTWGPAVPGGIVLAKFGWPAVVGADAYIVAYSGGPDEVWDKPIEEIRTTEVRYEGKRLVHGHRYLLSFYSCKGAARSAPMLVEVDIPFMPRYVRNPHVVTSTTDTLCVRWEPPEDTLHLSKYDLYLDENSDFYAEVFPVTGMPLEYTWRGALPAQPQVRISSVRYSEGMAEHVFFKVPGEIPPL